MLNHRNTDTELILNKYWTDTELILNNTEPFICWYVRQIQSYDYIFHRYWWDMTELNGDVTDTYESTLKVGFGVFSASNMVEI